MSRLSRWTAPWIILGAGNLLPLAQAAVIPPLLPVAAQTPYQAEDLVPPTTRNGVEILERFHAGLANPQCDADATNERWKRQFRHATQRLGDPADPLLPLFGYVVDELHKANLPSEFALIPFVESGYRPGATSKSGPAGLWQFIASTARNHKVPMSAGIDGRLSASESTAAAVQYLKTLHGIFGGSWELTVMGYNAGEYRILQAMRRSGVNASNASPQALSGVPSGTYAYVEKLHALSCVIEEASARGTLHAAVDRDVPILTEVTLPAGMPLLQWAQDNQHPAETLKQLNPLLARGKPGRSLGALVPASVGTALATHSAFGGTEVLTASTEIQESALDTPVAAIPATAATSTGSKRQHTVRTGESLWAIARRHGLAVNTLLTLNALESTSILRPGMVLRLD